MEVLAFAATWPAVERAFIAFVSRLTGEYDFVFTCSFPLGLPFTLPLTPCANCDAVNGSRRMTCAARSGGKATLDPSRNVTRRVVRHYSNARLSSAIGWPLFLLGFR